MSVGSALNGAYSDESAALEQLEIAKGEMPEMAVSVGYQD